jgi:hypothetical protein
MRQGLETVGEVSLELLTAPMPPFPYSLIVLRLFQEILSLTIYFKINSLFSPIPPSCKRRKLFWSSQQSARTDLVAGKKCSRKSELVSLGKGPPFSSSFEGSILTGNGLLKLAIFLQYEFFFEITFFGLIHARNSFSFFTHAGLTTQK